VSVILILFSQESVVPLNNILEPQPNSKTNNKTSDTDGLQLYHNIEWGFEFWYPEGWTFHENTFYNPSSKFNLVGASPEENGRPNPIFPSLFINIVTIDFAANATIKINDIGAITSDIVIDGIRGTKYNYTEKVPRILVDVSFDQYNLFVAAHENYEDTLNQILLTFKFLK